jgi:hypothetical protein
VRIYSATGIAVGFVLTKGSCYKKRMVTKRQTVDAIAALEAGDLSKAVRIAAKAVQGGLPFVMEALQTGFALGQASKKGETPPPEAVGFLRFLAAAPGAAEGFRSLREGLGISQAEIAKYAASRAPSCPIGSEERPRCRQRRSAPFKGWLWVALIAVSEHSLWAATSRGSAKRLE